MSMINWKTAQRKLGITVDGLPGPQTVGTLLTYVMGRSVPKEVSAGILLSLRHLTTPQRLADFIAQTAHESANYTRFVENLNYSGDQALRSWPLHFTKASAARAHRNPQLIAEIAYGTMSRQGKGRMGNTKPGDGWKYRGRGAIQLTGKNNYSLYGRLIGRDLVANPDLAADPTIGMQIAIQFYLQNGVFRAIDENDPLGARKIVNMGNRNAKGSPNGYSHVNAIRAKVLSLFAP